MQLLGFMIAAVTFLGTVKFCLAQDSASDSEEENVSLAIAQFGMDLLHQLPYTGENVMFSPFSIATAFAFLSLGAGGETLDQINSAFHFNEIAKNSPNGVHQAFKKILDKYEKQNTNSNVSIANGLFEQMGYDIKEKFQSDAKKYYDADIKEVDFASASTADEINRWVEEKTNGKIKNLFESGTLSADTILALVNAIYFYGNWKTQFEEYKTHEMDFFVSENKPKKVQMMNVESHFYYGEDDELQAKILRMPYDGEQLSMTIILPEQGELSEVIQKLDAQKLRKLNDGLGYSKVNVMLPKFKLDTSYSLQGYLEKLGVKDVFTSGANLSMISDGSLQVSKAVHKAYVDVSEKGTEAAAATGIVVVESNAVFEENDDKSFIADRPFLFIVGEGSALFLGVYSLP